MKTEFKKEDAMDSLLYESMAGIVLTDRKDPGTTRTNIRCTVLVPKENTTYRIGEYIDLPWSAVIPVRGSVTIST